MSLQVRARLMDAPKQSAGGVAPTTVFPHRRPLVLAIAGRSQHRDTLRRGVQAELYGDRVRAREVRVVRVDEEPRGFRLAARPAHSRRRRGQGEAVICVAVIEGVWGRVCS